MDNKNSDIINHPEHYTENKYECIEEMQMLFGIRAVITYCKLAAYKYKHRANFKGNKKQDLEKADWYFSKMKELQNGSKYGF